MLKLSGRLAVLVLVADEVEEASYSKNLFFFVCVCVCVWLKPNTELNKYIPKVRIQFYTDLSLRKVIRMTGL